MTPFSICSTVKDQLQLLCWYLTYACFYFCGVSPVGCFFMTWCLETRQWLVHASSMHLRIGVMLTVKPVFEGLPIPVWGRHTYSISNNKVLYIVHLSLAISCLNSVILKFQRSIFPKKRKKYNKAFIMKKNFFQQALFPNNKVSNTKTYKKCGRLYSRLSTYVKKWSKEQKQKIRSRKKNMSQPWNVHMLISKWRGYSLLVCFCGFIKWRKKQIGSWRCCKRMGPNLNNAESII